MKRYARTVKSGERPLMVCTRDTGIFSVAVEESMCPPIWKSARGRVVDITSRLGYRIPFLKAGIAVLRRGKRRASHAKKRHQPETKANCMIVSVIGLGKALSIDFEEVLVKAELRYQTRQRIWNSP